MAYRTSYVERRDGAEATSDSVFYAIQAALDFCRGSESLQDRTIAIQGVGAVGSRLAGKCIDAGAHVVVADTSAGRIAALSAALPVKSCPPDEILRIPADVLAPCAVGSVIRFTDVGALRCAILCGGANNILDQDETSDILAANGILYVPDFIVNSGAAIEAPGRSYPGRGDYRPQIAAVRRGVREILDDAERANVSPLAAALRNFAASADAATGPGPWSRWSGGSNGGPPNPSILSMAG